MSEPKPKAVLLFGPPGAGKGTIGAMLCAAGNHYHLSSGDIFRGLPPESKNGQLFYEYANAGRLVPDDITIEIFWRYVKGLMDTNRYYPSQQLLILDGVPRTVEQARLLERHVEVLHVISLNIYNDEEIFRRISRRAKIEKRVDDASKEIISNRLCEYREKTKLVLDFYPKEIVSGFNAENTPLEVLRDVLVGCTHVLKQKPTMVPSNSRVKVEPAPPGVSAPGKSS